MRSKTKVPGLLRTMSLVAALLLFAVTHAQDDLSKLIANADGGDIKSQCRLATLYMLGSRVNQDSDKAVYWFRQAANQGDPAAQTMLGRIYTHGVGVERDYVQAKDWLLLAARQGYAGAQSLLGDLYYLSLGVSKDWQVATMWYGKAARGGDADAQYMMGVMNDLHGGKSQDLPTAASWYRKAAEQGHSQAAFMLGMMYENGEGVPRNLIQSYMWLSLAANDGIQDAVTSRDKVARLMSEEDRTSAKAMADEKQTRIETHREEYGAPDILMERLYEIKQSGAKCAPVESFEAGGTPIAIPPPTAEFSEIGHDNREFMETYVLGNISGLIAYFVLAEDLKELTKGSDDLVMSKYAMVTSDDLVMSKYAMVMVEPSSEYVNYGASDFEDLIDGIRDEFGEEEFGVFMNSSIKETEDEFNRRMKSLDLDEATINFDKPIQLGCLFSMQNAYGFGVIMPMSIGGENMKMGSGTALMRVKQRLLIVCLYAEYKDEETVKWLRKTTGDWAAAILKANE